MTLKEEKRRLLAGIVSFAAITLLLWLVKGIELMAGVSFSRYGIIPLQSAGLPGILLSPLIHADVSHLTANSPPLFLLGAALVYYYRKEAFKIFGLMWVLTGAWVWLFARGNAVHIGASGVVYALASFHFVSGLIRREPRLMAFSMLVIFLYGSMVWGIFPDFFPKKNISWESHLMGIVAGVVLALYYRNSGPQRVPYLWEDEEESEDDENGEAVENETETDKPATSEQRTLQEGEPVNRTNETKTAPPEIKINYEYRPPKSD